MEVTLTTRGEKVIAFFRLHSLEKKKEAEDPASPPNLAVMPTFRVLASSSKYHFDHAQAPVNRFLIPYGRAKSEIRDWDWSGLVEVELANAAAD